VVIVVEGNIGAGKSTLAQEISDSLGIPFYPELKDEATNWWLSKFYADMSRYAFALQMHFLNERFRKIKDIFSTDAGGVLDRSIYGDKIFADVLREDGHMTHMEHNEYVNLLSNMLEHANRPHLLVFLHCSVDTAMERIKKRDRTYESSIPRDYLAKLHDRYEQWYMNYSASPKIYIDTDRYPIDNPGNMGKVADMIRWNLGGVKGPY
jgi:deoxyadenosine/deoxycytidine kinase